MLLCKSSQVRRASACDVACQPLWKDQWLMQMGVGCLNGEQVLAVVERRL
jgi:hypothetical protein